MSKLDENEVMRELKEAVIEINEERLRKATGKAIKENISFRKVVNEGIGEGLRILGNRFEKGEIILPELVIAGDQMDAAVEILKENLGAEDEDVLRGKVVMGTVKDDIHDIGKNIVSAMLKAAGFEVIDLGTDVSTDEFLHVSKSNDADIIGVSALLSSTMREQKRLIELLETEGVRQKYRVMVGGGQASQEWADEIGADGYAVDATKAVALAKKLIEE